jgi:hypothetical protein
VPEPALGLLERGRESVGLDVRAVERGDAAPASECVAQVVGETTRVGRPDADDGEDRGSGARELEPAARLKLARQLSRDGERERAVALDEPQKASRLQLEQAAVADCADVGGARRARQQAQLAEGGSRPDLAQHAPVLRRHDLKAAAEHDVEPIGALARAEQPVSRVDPHLPRRVGELVERSCGRAAEQRRIVEGGSADGLQLRQDTFLTAG